MSKERNKCGMLFSDEMRKQVRLEQHGRCAECGSHRGTSLQIHHRLPVSYIRQLRSYVDAATYSQFKEFAKSRDNAVGLCGRPSCHPHIDALAIENHVFYGFRRPLGIPVDPARFKGKERL